MTDGKGYAVQEHDIETVFPTATFDQIGEVAMSGTDYKRKYLSAVRIQLNLQVLYIKDCTIYE